MDGRKSVSHNIVTYENGSSSLCEIATGEVMHSSIGPWEEANQLYVSQSHLKQRLETNPVSPTPLVIHDVGMGIAANALAAIELHESMTQPCRRLQIISFENDPSGLQTALDQKKHFPFLERHEGIAATLLRDNQWTSPDQGIIWTLLPGSYVDQLPAAPPADLIFYDFYPPKNCAELWTHRYFHDAFVHSTENAMLFTYCSATAIRSALLLAGFCVGHGVSTQMKLDTTVAAKKITDLQKPLNQRWLDRFSRSPKRLPADAQGRTKEVLDHPQFKLG